MPAHPSKPKETYEKVLKQFTEEAVRCFLS